MSANGFNYVGIDRPALKVFKTPPKAKTNSRCIFWLLWGFLLRQVLMGTLLHNQ